MGTIGGTVGRLIEENDLILLSWPDPFGRGVWVVLAEHLYVLSAIEESVCNGDQRITKVCTDYILNPDWLPVALEYSFIAALRTIEAKLQALPLESEYGMKEWDDRVIYAFIELKHNYHEYEEHKNFENFSNSLPTLPKKYN